MPPPDEAIFVELHVKTNVWGYVRNVWSAGVSSKIIHRPAIRGARTGPYAPLSEW
jgi:hypothetical protein